MRLKCTEVCTLFDQVVNLKDGVSTSKTSKTEVVLYMHLLNLPHERVSNLASTNTTKIVWIGLYHEPIRCIDTSSPIGNGFMELSGLSYNGFESTQLRGGSIFAAEKENRTI